MNINWVAVVVAGVSAFVLGGIWYGAIFAEQWRKLNGLTEADLASQNKTAVFGISLILSLAAAAVFALFLGPDPALGFAVSAGASAGLFWVSASMAINYLFSGRPAGLFAIDGGYHTLQFTLYGFVLGLL